MLGGDAGIWELARELQGWPGQRWPEWARPVATKTPQAVSSGKAAPLPHDQANTSISLSAGFPH